MKIEYIDYASIPSELPVKEAAQKLNCSAIRLKKLCTAEHIEYNETDVAKTIRKKDFIRLHYKLYYESKTEEK